MLFPTIDFAIFFGIVFVGNWLLAPFPTRWRIFILVASYVFYGWWDWRFVFLLAISTALHDRRGPARPSGAQPDGQACLADRRRSLPSSDCWAGSSTPAGSASTSTTFSTTSAWAIPYRCSRSPSRRDLLFHLHGAVLRDRHLPGQPRAVAVVRRGGLRRFLPASRRRADRPGLGPSAADPPGAPARPAAHRPAESRLSHLRRPVQEGRALELRLVPDRRPGLREPAHALLARGPACRSTATRCRSTATSADTPTSPSVARSCSASAFRRTSTPPIPPGRCRISGGAGTSPCRCGYATTSTSLSAATRAHGPAMYRNIMITMVLGGLWHGAAWTFIAWGAYHGVGQCLGHYRRAKRVEAGSPPSKGGGLVGRVGAFRDLPARLRRAGSSSAPPRFPNGIRRCSDASSRAGGEPSPLVSFAGPPRDRGRDRHPICPERPAPARTRGVLPA